MSTSSSRAALAAHRFGFGEADLGLLRSDPEGWIRQQWAAPAQPPADGAWPSAVAGALSRQVQAEALAPGDIPSAREQLRRGILNDWTQRWTHTLRTPTPVYERWVQHWANHLCVSGARPVVRALVLPYEREVVRAQVHGRFADLLKAAVRHPALLLYLDNAQSIGPRSRAGQGRGRGLNENLARELLELHTLGVDGGYTQADVTETARLLTGWTVTLTGPATAMSAAEAPAEPAAPPAMRTTFNPRWHEPGERLILGRRYPEGPESLDRLLEDLARHPSTARHVSRRLARHFVADEPPAALVEALSAAWIRSDGDLPTLAATLFAHPLTWEPGTGKFKRPEEWLVSAHRVLGLSAVDGLRWTAALNALGQPAGLPPSPQGWSDLDADWLGPDALMKRARWALAFAQREAAAHAGTLRVPSEGFERIAGTTLRPDTRREIDRADSSAQALALWLASPDFLRR